MGGYRGGGDLEGRIGSSGGYRSRGDRGPRDW